MLSAPADSVVSGTSGDEGSDLASLGSTDDTDAIEVQRQNLPLSKRRRSVHLLDHDTPDIEDARHAVSFRPFAVEHQVHQSIVNPAFQGKPAQTLLEYFQRSDHVRFLATPPTLRSLYDFSFGERGLSIMHLATATVSSRLQAAETGIDMDFSRKNSLRSAAPPTSFHQILSALQNLRVFTEKFYNPMVLTLVDRATQFLGRYGAGGVKPDTCKALVF